MAEASFTHRENCTELLMNMMNKYKNRKPQFRFSASRDIELLGVTLNLRPWETGWDPVQGKMFTEFGYNLTARTCKDRVKLLVADFKKYDKECLKKNGTEEELSLKYKMLQEICKLMESTYVDPSEVPEKQEILVDPGIILSESEQGISTPGENPECLGIHTWSPRSTSSTNDSCDSGNGIQHQTSSTPNNIPAQGDEETLEITSPSPQPASSVTGVAPQQASISASKTGGKKRKMLAMKNANGDNVDQNKRHEEMLLRIFGVDSSSVSDLTPKKKKLEYSVEMEERKLKLERDKLEAQKANQERQAALEEKKIQLELEKVRLEAENEKARLRLEEQRMQQQQKFMETNQAMMNKMLELMTAFRNEPNK